jgi:hypothetical protein
VRVKTLTDKATTGDDNREAKAVHHGRVVYGLDVVEALAAPVDEAAAEQGEGMGEGQDVGDSGQFDRHGGDAEERAAKNHRTRAIGGRPHILLLFGDAGGEDLGDAVQRDGQRQGGSYRPGDAGGR